MMLLEFYIFFKETANRNRTVFLHTQDIYECQTQTYFLQ